MVTTTSTVEQTRVWNNREDFQRLLKREGLNQHDIAGYLGVSDAAITKWMREGFPVRYCMELAIWLDISAWAFTSDAAAVRLLKLYGVRAKHGRGFAEEYARVS